MTICVYILNIHSAPIKAESSCCCYTIATFPRDKLAMFQNTANSSSTERYEVLTDSGFTAYERRVRYCGNEFRYVDIERPSYITIHCGSCSYVSVEFYKGILPEHTIWDKLRSTFPDFTHRAQYGDGYGLGRSQDHDEYVLLSVLSARYDSPEKENVQKLFRLVHELYNLPEEIRHFIEKIYGTLVWQ